MAISHALEHFPCGCNAGTRLRWAFSPMKTPLHAAPGIPSNRENALESQAAIYCEQLPGDEVGPGGKEKHRRCNVLRGAVASHGSLVGEVLIFRPYLTLHDHSRRNAVDADLRRPGLRHGLREHVQRRL